MPIQSLSYLNVFLYVLTVQEFLFEFNFHFKGYYVNFNPPQVLQYSFFLFTITYNFFFGKI